MAGHGWPGGTALIPALGGRCRQLALSEFERSKLRPARVMEGDPSQKKRRLGWVSGDVWLVWPGALLLGMLGPTFSQR